MFVAFALALAVACSGSPHSPTTPTPLSETTAVASPTSAPTTPPATAAPEPPPPAFAPTGQTAIVAAVGDIGECGSVGVQRTARLIERIDGQLLLAGDLAYMEGSMQDFLRCFDPHYGQFRRRWRPAAGNHEYGTPGAAGYFQYFGESRSYYAFRTGDWHVLMLNSNEPTSIGSPQFEFVRNELVTTRALCTMAVWHHPLFTSGPNGPNVFMRDMWGLLYQHNADVVVAGHDHLYERFGKQDVDGRSDARGLRQFIAGTGGARLYDFMRVSANSQARVKAHGVLRLTLNPSSYEWAFLDAAGGTGDSGSDSCH
jgi:acid phosphatase type 7